MTWQFLMKPNVIRSIRNIGIILFILSFFVPSLDRSGNLQFFEGSKAFYTTPMLAYGEIIHYEKFSEEGFTFLVLIAAWISNFTIFIDMPLVATLIAILLPWPAFFVYFHSFLSVFIPFYFWVAGMTLIHFSRILRRQTHNIPYSA